MKEKSSLEVEKQNVYLKVHEKEKESNESLKK